MAKKTRDPAKAPAGGKNKREAILLGLAAGPVSWLYTYDKDKARLWTGLALEVVAWVAIFTFLLGDLKLLAFVNYGESLSLGELADTIRYLAWDRGPSLSLYAAYAGASTVLLVRAWLLFDRSLKPAKQYKLYRHRPLNRTVAVLAAVMFAYNTWLYTYEKDRRKFWLGFVVAVAAITVPVSTIFVESKAVDLILIWIGIPAVLAAAGIHVWAIINVATRDDDWYRAYPANPSAEPKRHMAK
ncbi:hypothetical protein F4X86_01170 [Candidatus Saccharibacteria bacterium]|nr:hypothetical protein [Candidatus Saccharibacteria bacterium]